MPTSTDQHREVEDPKLREAVLDLFRANDAFRVAYTDYQKTEGRDKRALEALASAEARVDFARHRVIDLQLDES